ncbi:hypothetical protein IGS73_06290 [Janibacter indicus]|uniref:Uncharacterized protein n=1 Tax=Janibacter indicus TaxID=857417 RepID=A0A7L9J2Z3_9MICO|nr:hypothetical protein [Janibacter indicus]QOK23981.1 hypothetical protein IGS73_06290 [Janibacter indicus]
MSEPSTTTRLRCDRCGSHATHERVMGMPSAEAAEQIAATPGQRLGGCLIVPGMWTVECLTCGQRDEVEGEPADFTSVPMPDHTVARAITQYAARCRQELDQAIAPVVSHAGLWLLLATVAEHVSGDDRVTLEQTLGIPADEASSVARRLLAEPHPTLAAAVGTWAADDVVTPVEVERPVPDQIALDAWASQHTRGLIDSFPLQVDELTRVVLATALVLEPRWTESLVTDGSRVLKLHGGLQTIVETTAAGPVVVAKPHSEDGIDVVSVRAHPRVPPSQVWQAVDEVVAMLDDGALWHAEIADGLPERGHSWRAATVRRDLLASELQRLPTDAEGQPQLWTSRLPVWSAQDSIDLGAAPGVAQVGSALTPEEPAAATDCRQVVRAEFDADGFKAAAVTAMARVGSAPEFVKARVRRVDLDLRGSHAVVAVARGGAWEGVPLVSAWVSGPNYMDSDGEALELLAETDPDEAAALSAYKEAQMRQRGEIR